MNNTCQCHQISFNFFSVVSRQPRCRLFSNQLLPRGWPLIKVSIYLSFVSNGFSSFLMKYIRYNIACNVVSWTKTLPKESLLKCVLSRHLMSKTFGVYRLFLWVQVSFVRLGLIYMECSVRSAWSFLLYVSNSFTIMVFDVEFTLNFQVLHSPKYILRQCNAETSLRTRFTSLEMW